MAADGDSSNGTFVDIENIAGVDPAMTRIDRSSTITKIDAYEIKQNLSKKIFLLLGRCYYDGIAHWFFFILLLATAFALT